MTTRRPCYGLAVFIICQLMFWTFLVCAQDQPLCDKLLGARTRPFAALVVADTGEFSGTPEATYLERNVQAGVQSNSTVFCQKVVYGSIMGQDVAIVYTGIGPIAAAMCTIELLQACGESMTELTYLGTAGFQPLPGGVLRAEDCSRAHQQGPPSRIGDLCISPYSINWACKSITWPGECRGFPDLCSMPVEQSSPDEDALFGKCIFNSAGPRSLELSRELAAAAAKTEVGARASKTPAAIQADRDYWAAMSQGTGIMYEAVPEAPPAVFDALRCVEVSNGGLIYAGPPYDMVANEYAALALPADAGGNSSQVLAVSAFEGVGWMAALEQYASRGGRQIPFANVRANAAWSHDPVQKKADGTWSFVPEFVAASFEDTYAQAIRTYSAAVLTMLQGRCLARTSAPSACAWILERNE